MIVKVNYFDAYCLHLSFFSGYLLLALSFCTSWGKVHLYSATIAAYAASAALLSQTGPAFSLGHSLSRRSRTLACSHTAVGSQSPSFLIVSCVSCLVLTAVKPFCYLYVIVTIVVANVGIFSITSYFRFLICSLNVNGSFELCGFLRFIALYSLIVLLLNCILFYICIIICCMLVSLPLAIAM